MFVALFDVNGQEVSYGGYQRVEIPKDFEPFTITGHGVRTNWVDFPECQDTGIVLVSGYALAEKANGPTYKPASLSHTLTVGIGVTVRIQPELE